MTKPKDPAVRFAAQTRTDGDCIRWTGWHTHDGYGIFSITGPRKRKVRAHRWAYEQAKGAIPDGLQIDHLCRVRDCVNPDHLEPVTARENTLRSKAPGVGFVPDTHCHRGHEFHVVSDRKVCRICSKAASDRYKLRQRIAAGFDPDAPKTCPRGHDLTVNPPQIVRRSNGKVSHLCRPCLVARERRYKAKKKETAS